MTYIGINWPAIDEDSVGEPASHGRRFEQNTTLAESSHGISARCRVAIVVFGRETKREREWRRLAEGGDVEAAYALGAGYRARTVRSSRSSGPRSAKELRREAVQWLSLAADAGHVEALADLNSLAWDYPGWLDTKLIRYVRKSADAGDLEAAYRLGQRIETGFVGADAASSVTSQEAEGYLRQAADGGHRGAARVLGIFLAARTHGHGTVSTTSKPCTGRARGRGTPNTTSGW